jgi:hypothetical protein
VKHCVETIASQDLCHRWAITYVDLVQYCSVRNRRGMPVREVINYDNAMALLQ